MALKDKFRRAMGRTSDTRSSSSSTSSTRPPTGTTTPSEPPLSQVPTATNTTSDAPPPSITLTKTTTQRLGLSKTLSFHHGHKSHPSKEEKQHEKAEKQWRKQDEEEWKTPKPGRRRDVKCQNTLRAFDFKMCDGAGEKDCRKGSACSGVSPCASARTSVDERGPGASTLRSEVAVEAGGK